jgi:lipid-A-disaccharide synthase
LELALRAKSIKTAHYVSPSVWAWRQGRITKIKQAVDLMLTLFPFENAIYEQHAIHAVCVGHPLADEIAVGENTVKARDSLGLQIPEHHKIVALLPGSRHSEVARLAAVFFATAQQLLQTIPDLSFVCPAANAARLQQLLQLKAQFPKLPIHIVDGGSHSVMAAADLVIMASGTTTLEAMLFKKPMIIAYKVAPLSYWIYRQLVKVSMIGLPNLLAGKCIVPEFIQTEANEANLTQVSLDYLQNTIATQTLKQEFTRLHLALRQNGNVAAAHALAQLIENT